MYIAPQRAAQWSFCVPHVPHYKPLQQMKMIRATLQSAAALYVPLLHYPMKTAAKQPTSRWSSTFGKHSLRLQEKTHNAKQSLI